MPHHQHHQQQQQQQQLLLLLLLFVIFDIRVFLSLEMGGPHEGPPFGFKVSFFLLRLLKLKSAAKNKQQQKAAYLVAGRGERLCLLLCLFVSVG